VFRATRLYRLADVPEGPEDSDRQLAGGASTTAKTVPRNTFTLRSSHAEERLALALDGDLESRWISGQPQTGDEWLRVELDRPRDVANVRLGLTRRSFGDYPRRLVIECSEDGETYSVLHDGSVLPRFVLQIVRGGQITPIDITLPPNRTTVLRIRQTGRTRTWFWAIHELDLHER
jgi:hypothetical protein